MAGRPIVALISLVLLAGGVLFQFFVILSGATSGNPEPKFWFLAADTSAVGNNAPFFTAWTYFAVCNITGLGSGATTFGCGPAKAALPFNPPENFGSTQNLPPQFLNTHHYYYLSRFAWAFYIIALFFGVISLFSSLLALCTRIGSYLSGFLVFLAVFFQALASALMTAWTVQARNAFRSNGQSASLGRYSYGFSWAAVFAFLISSILFCIGGSMGSNERRVAPPSRFGMFGRNRSTRSRGSFAAGADAENGRVKDDYE